MQPHREIINVAAEIDRMLNDHRLSIKATIALLRERTGTKRSYADLEGLIVKKATVRGISILHDLDPGSP